MIVIFSDVDGTITRVVNEEHWVQSDRNAHDIDVIFNQGFDNTEYNGYIQFLREGESKPSPKLIMTPKIITYGEGTFRGYSFRVQTEWHTAIAGTLKATIEIKQYEDTGLETNKAFGIVNIPIEEALSDNPEVESTITNEEYLALINAINAKSNIDNEKVYYFKNVSFTTNEDFVDECRSHKSNYKSTNIYLGNVALNPTLAIVNDNDEVVVISSTGKFLLYDQSNAERPLTMEYLKSAELTITKLLDVSQALLLCKEPTANNHATTKKYVDDIKTALEDLVSESINEAMIIVDNSVTSTSENPVKSKGIYSFVENEINKEVTNRENSINAAKTELNTNIANATTKAKLKETLGMVSETSDGLLSATDYNTLMNLVYLLNTDESTYVDTFNEILHIFEEYPEGANIYEILNSKAEKTEVDILKEKVENLETSGSDVTYTNTTPTSAALGGIAKGTTFENKSIKEMFDMLLYPYVAFKISSFSASPYSNSGYYKVGNSVTVTNVTVNITNGSEAITNITVFKDNDNTVVGSKTSGIGTSNTITLNSSQTLSSDTKFYAKVTDGKSTITSSYVYYKFINPYYYGVANAGVTITADVVKGGTESVTAESNKTLTFTMNNQVTFFAYPSSYGTLSKILDVNGFNVTDTFNRSTMTINGVSYYVYVLANANTATMTYTFYV